MAVGNPITELSTTGNFVPVTRTLTINGVSYDLSADRSWSIASPGGGSVTSVAMTVPTGFSVSGSPITSAGTLAVTFASGYALPTTVKQSNWDDAYTFVSNFPSQTGNNGKFLYTSGSVLSWQTALQNPMTALGDMLFGGVSGAVTVLPGNQFTTRAYLQQVGTGSGSAAPTWGGIVSTDISGQAITRVNDTNVTLTLTGTPGNSVLNAVGLTLGWSGTLTAGRGGTGTSGVTGIMLGNSTAPVTGITGIGGQILRANPSTGVYEFWTPTYLESPLTLLGQIIYGGAGGQPIALNPNSTANNMYLRSVSSGIPSWASIAGGDIVGAGLTKTDDTNVTLTLGGTPNNSLLRSVSLTMGWTGQLSVPRGGTGVSTITGVVIGNGTGVMTGVAGTASQLLRRDATNSFYEFFTHNFLSNPMTTLSDIIVANAAGAPIRLAANTTADNLYLRTVSGAIGYAAIQGSHIVGAGISRTNDTNIQVTLGGATTDGLLRAVSLTMGWAGTLSATRGGTGTSGLTGIIYGNGASAMTAITGVGGQILRIAPITTAYEFWTPTYLDNVMTSLGDTIYGNASGAPVRLAANSTSSNMFLRSVSSGAPSWSAIGGADITGAAITTANDTNILITASGNTTNALLRTLTLTAGWTGALSPQRGGTGASTLTGVVIGNGIGTMVGVAGTADQLLRRNSANTAYEFFTPTFLSNPMTTLGDIIYGNAAGAPLRLGANATSTNKFLRSVSGGTPSWEELPASVSGSGTANYVAKWASSTALTNSLIYDNGTNVGIGTPAPAYKFVVSNANTVGMEFDPGTIVSGRNRFFSYNRSTSAYVDLEILANNVIITPTANLGIGTATPAHKLEVVGVISGGNASATTGSIILQDTYSAGHLGNIGTMFSSGNFMLGYAVTPSTSSATSFLSSAFVSGVDFARSSITLGTDVSIYTGAAQSVAIGSSVTMSERLRLLNSGQLRLLNYTSTSSFSGLTVGYLGFTSTGAITTNAIPGGVSGTQNYLAKFDSTGLAVTDSRFIDNGTNFLLNGASSYVTGFNLIGDVGIQSASGQASSIIQRSNQTPTSGTTFGILDAYAITTGSTYTIGGGIEFRASQNWNSTSAGTNIFVQTAPDNTIAPADMFVFLNNGAVRFIGRTSNPLSPAAGTMYYNSSANNMRYYNGTTWITF
jgi:hypothetical protein